MEWKCQSISICLSSDWSWIKQTIRSGFSDIQSMCYITCCWNVHTDAGTEWRTRRSYETLLSEVKLKRPLLLMFILCNARIRKLEQMTYVGHREEKKIRALTCELVQSRGKRLRALLNQKEYPTPCLPRWRRPCAVYAVQICAIWGASVHPSSSVSASSLLEERCGWHASARIVVASSSSHHGGFKGINRWPLDVSPTFRYLNKKELEIDIWIKDGSRCT